MAQILVVDDHEAVRASIRRMLESVGHTVSEAGNGFEALRVLSPETELVITDVIMPEMDGLEMVRYLRRTRQNLPILVITGGWSAPSDLVSIAVNLGADRAMSKTKVSAELVATVTQMIGSVSRQH
jgi:CheY-like chemotaxis protein